MGMRHSVDEILGGQVTSGDGVSVIGWLCSDGFDCWLVNGEALAVPSDQRVLIHPELFDRSIAPLGMLSAGGELCFAERAVVVGKIVQAGPGRSLVALEHLQKVTVIDDEGNEVLVDLSGPPSGPVVIE